MRIVRSFQRTFVFSVFVAAAWAADPPEYRIFGPSQVQEVYRVVLHKDALLLETIAAVVKQKGVTDGQVTISAGSVQECTYHYVTSTAQKPKDEYKTVKGNFEILGASGIVANGEPHIHITLSSPEKGAFGGHLEKGCRILYLGEFTLVKYAGPGLIRRPDANGVSILEPK